MPNLRPEVVRGFLSAIFEASGATPENAGIVASSLVEAELAGHASHGVIRVVEYLEQIRKGRLVPDAQPRALREGATTLLVDGCWGFGQVVAGWATERVIEKAVANDVAVVAAQRSGHIGRVGVYTGRAAAAGLLSMAFVNGGGATPRLAPYGGSRPMFGTNPLSAAVPVAGRAPIVVDFSTAVVASGKIRVRRDQGEPLPEGWILDRYGRPSTKPADYYDGGMLLPAAGHKGYGLAVLVEVFGGLLSGAGSTVLSDDPAGVGNGTVLMALNPAAFDPARQFEQQVRDMADAIKATPAAAGFTEVLLPGEPEARAAAEAASNGVVVAETTWARVLEAAASLGVRSSVPE